ASQIRRPRSGYTGERAMKASAGDGRLRRAPPHAAVNPDEMEGQVGPPDGRSRGLPPKAAGVCGGMRHWADN
ncbi:unnamed protein product, partial [Ectocarpus fasciculatus]